MMISLIGVQVYALAMKKIAIMNHALFNSLFLHPDDRQSWNPKEIQTARVNKDLRHHIIPLESAAVVARHVKYIGVHGVGSLQQSYKHVSNILSKPYRSCKQGVMHSRELQNLECQSFAAWMLSNPSPRALNALKEFKRSLNQSCGQEESVPDLVLQLRDADEGPRHRLSRSAINCHVQCTIRQARQMHAANRRPVCIFVTSNNRNATRFALKNMSSKLENGSYEFMIQSYQQHPGTISHTGDIIQRNRKSTFFNISHHDVDIMHWLLSGEATTAVYSHSTFMMSARLRLGSSKRQIFDPQRRDILPMLDMNGHCKCISREKQCFM